MKNETELVRIVVVDIDVPWWSLSWFVFKVVAAVAMSSFLMWILFFLLFGPKILMRGG